jgi:uncharacterized protein (TIGR00251 family)
MSASSPLNLVVRLTPRAGRDGVDGWGQDEAGRLYLKVRVAAPPVDGAANAALQALIAKTLKRPKSAVRIVAGDHARLKQLEVQGADQADLIRAFGAPA